METLHVQFVVGAASAAAFTSASGRRVRKRPEDDGDAFTDGDAVFASAIFARARELAPSLYVHVRRVRVHVIHDEDAPRAAAVASTDALPLAILRKVSARTFNALVDGESSLVNLSGVTFSHDARPRRIFFNASNWAAVPTSMGSEYTSLPAFRAHLLLHEVGHARGAVHAVCPHDGARASVMMQPTHSLSGCRPPLMVSHAMSTAAAEGDPAAAAADVVAAPASDPVTASTFPIPADNDEEDAHGNTNVIFLGGGGMEGGSNTSSRAASLRQRVRALMFT